MKKQQKMSQPSQEPGGDALWRRGQHCLPRGLLHHRAGVLPAGLPIPLPHPKEILPPKELSLSKDHAATATGPPLVSPHQGEPRPRRPAAPHSPGPRGSPAQQAGAGAN